jgi:long-chain acyl-CoA synthetase
MGKKRAKKTKPWTKRRIRRLKRSDGLTMKLVTSFTMDSVVESTASRHPKRVALRLYRDDESAVTFGELKQAKDAIGLYLIDHGFEKGDKIALIGESCPTWLVAYFGLTSIGCIAVPVLPDFSAKEMGQILEHSGAKGVIVNAKHFEKVIPFVRENPDGLFRMEDLFHIPHPISAELANKEQFSWAPGRDIRRRKIDGKSMAVRAKRLCGENDIASIIYTSGTTGSSKAVMLTHKNLVWNADISSDVYIHLKPGNRVLSLLPISHVYEFTVGQLLELLCGCEIVYLGKAPAPSILLPALKEVRPHVVMTVPLLIEKVYRSSVLPALKGNPKMAKWQSFGPARRLIARVAGRKLKVNFGGKIRFFGIGGAPLDLEVESFLADASFPYSIGYGLTETSPLIAGGLPNRHYVGTIGKLVEHLDVKIDNPDPETGVGEILVKGPSVMVGYYKNDELNREAFTDDGYFRTGDLGHLDRRGRLSIKGRTKTMILGSGGENIYPELIEALINNLEYVTESLVIPEQGGLAALIKIDLDSFAEKMALNVNDAKVEAIKYVTKIRDDVNKELAVFSRIRTAELQEEPFDRTPTQKIKRFLYSRLKDGSDQT